MSFFVTSDCPFQDAPVMASCTICKQSIRMIKANTQAKAHVDSKHSNKKFEVTQTEFSTRLRKVQEMAAAELFTLLFRIVSGVLPGIHGMRGTYRPLPRLPAHRRTRTSFKLAWNPRLIEILYSSCHRNHRFSWTFAPPHSCNDSLHLCTIKH